MYLSCDTLMRAALSVRLLLTFTAAAAAMALQAAPTPGRNLAVVASPTTSYVSGHETITALNDGFDPENSNDKRHGAYGNWPRTGTQWVQYEWSQPVSLSGIDVFWFDDHGGVRLPTACRLFYWDGQSLVPVPDARGLGLEENKFNSTQFPAVKTTRLRLEFDGHDKSSTGLLEWRVYDAGDSPNFPPVVSAGVDRVVLLKGKTCLQAAAKDEDTGASLKVRWSKSSGPGEVTFEKPELAATTAQFSAPGEYTLECRATDGQLQAADTLKVRVVAEAPGDTLTPVTTAAYTLTSPFWKPRIQNTIKNWIPHCIAKIEDRALPEGGIENFAQAGRKLAGKEAKHIGPPFANAWVYNTLESMCLAVGVDCGDDPAVRSAQQSMRKTIDLWVEKMLSAQEPDGYLQTMYTINGIPRWTNRHDHEGYNASYFIEAAMAHYYLTDGKDRRMADAAFRLADCWVRNIGPAPKRSWYEGHAGLEQTLIRLARFSEEVRGRRSGWPYVELAQYLLDARGNGDEYDQSHLPVTRQYEAVGHAVRAVYSYSGMAGVAMETANVDYYSAVLSLWDSLVNRKYYVTGGVGSGETSEGFGKEFSLPNHSYCESCAGCGEVFFQHNMHLALQHSKYADLFEETLYNAVLGSLDLDGQNFTYTNPLDSEHPRYKWHVCPCCVGNIPRTMLMLPSWMYSTGERSIYVNLYAGSTVKVGKVGGTPVTLEQQTAYPWDGGVLLTVKPERPARFSLHLRLPDRRTSELYSPTPAETGTPTLELNGKPVPIRVEKGYAEINRRWKTGDTLKLVLPLAAQRVHADARIKPLTGRVALRYGPLIYNLESVDQGLDSILPKDAPLSAEWAPTLLGGQMVLKGTFADGKPMTAIPNYSRLNRGGRSIVWIKQE